MRIFPEDLFPEKAKIGEKWIIKFNIQVQGLQDTLLNYKKYNFDYKRYNVRR